MDSEVIKKLVEQVVTKKTKDYTYIVIFFLIFSFFIFFAIRPSLITALSLAAEENQLNKTNASYEADIVNILSLQNALQNYQDRLYLLADSLPDKPQLNKILTDIEQNGEKNSVVITKMNFNEVALTRKQTTDLHTVEVNIQAATTYENLLSFIEDLSNQRRIKSIDKIDILKDSNDVASSSKDLNVSIKILGYYL